MNKLYEVIVVRVVTTEGQEANEGQAAVLPVTTHQESSRLTVVAENAQDAISKVTPQITPDEYIDSVNKIRDIDVS